MARVSFLFIYIWYAVRWRIKSRIWTSFWEACHIRHRRSGRPLSTPVWKPGKDSQWETMTLKFIRSLMTWRGPGLLASAVNPLTPLPLGERHRWRGTGFRKSPRKLQTIAVCYRLFPTYFLRLAGHFSKDEASIFWNSQSQRVWDYISHAI